MSARGERVAAVYFCDVLSMYTLETVDLLACDFSKPAAAVSELRSAWESLSSPNDVKEEFSLSIKLVARGLVFARANKCAQADRCIHAHAHTLARHTEQRNTSHVTRHTSHVARHTSHITRSIRDIVQAAATLSAGMNSQP